MPALTANLLAESVGALLKQAREEARLDIREVAQRTKIPERYVALFERDAHAELADDVYTKIYLKAYGKFLGFDTGALLDHYRKERARHGIPVRGGGLDAAGADRHPKTSVSASLLVVTPKVMQVALVACLAAGLLGWLGVEVKKIVAPPEIALSSPRDGLVTYDRTVSIDGTTEKEVSLDINGKEVSPDDTGAFHDSLDLQEGLNVITITGAKKHSKTMTVSRRVIVMPKVATDTALDPNAIDASTVAPVKAAPVLVPAAQKVTAPPDAAPAPTATPDPAMQAATAGETPTDAPATTP